MLLEDLIAALSVPAAYSYPVERVEVRQTHISVVFLAGPFAYKVKKAVNFGFLDFSTLEKRHHFCSEEVRLNRRLAPTVYKGVVPIVRTPIGLRIDPGATEGDVIEWAVKMERLPDEASLQSRVRRGEVGPALVAALAERVARFHAAAPRGPNISPFGRFDVVAGNARENFLQSVEQVGLTVSPKVFNRLRERTEESLVRLQPLIESREARGIPCETHGDLHLDHVYYFLERPAAEALVVIDCIEFNERFRYADPVADMAFLAMDFAFHGRRDLARQFVEAYFQGAHDDEGRALVAFYSAYRAAVRGKVDGMQLTEKEIPPAAKAAALRRARAHWLLALSELEDPADRPALVLIGGLPGTGKSTLAHNLARQAGFHVIRSDLVRKRLAGLDSETSARADFRRGIYTPAWTDRTYAECLTETERGLLEGQRILVDASFSQEHRRAAFLDLADRLAVPASFLLCQATPATVRQRLADRHNDPSDADWSVYVKATEHWEEISPRTRQVTAEIRTDDPTREALDRALEVLSEAGLVENAPCLGS